MNSKTWEFTHELSKNEFKVSFKALVEQKNKRSDAYRTLDMFSNLKIILHHENYSSLQTQTHFNIRLWYSISNHNYVWTLSTPNIMALSLVVMEIPKKKKSSTLHIFGRFCTFFPIVFVLDQLTYTQWNKGQAVSFSTLISYER